MAELLNCPFCGGSPNVHGDYERGFKVNHRCVGDSCSLIEFSRNTEAEAIAAWNRRAPSSPSIEREVSGEASAAGVAPTASFLSCSFCNTADACKVSGCVDAKIGRAIAAGERAASGVKGAPALPTTDELETLWETTHRGHPADFAADVLERWGGWMPGLLGHGGALQEAVKAQRNAGVPGAVPLSGGWGELREGQDYERTHLQHPSTPAPGRAALREGSWHFAWPTWRTLRPTSRATCGR